MDNYPLWYESIEDKDINDLLMQDIKEMFIDVDDLQTAKEYAEKIADQTKWEEQYGTRRRRAGSMTQLTNSNQRQIAFQGQMQDLNRQLESKKAMQKQLMDVIRRSGKHMCYLGGEIRDLEKEMRRLEIKNDNERRYNL